MARISLVVLVQQLIHKGAKDSFDALTQTQKALVTNAQTLEDAIARYAELKAAAEAPADSTDPTDPTDPGDHQGGDGLCKWCGKDHSVNFWQRIVGFFHSILYFFAHLFGLR